MTLRRPCENCPWRIDAPREYWDPSHFDEIAVNCRDDGLHIMICHKAGKLPVDERAEIPCQGWIRVMGFDAIGVRLLVMRGKITVEEVEDRNGPELFESFDAMLAANRIKKPGRNRWR